MTTNSADKTTNDDLKYFFGNGCSFTVKADKEVDCLEIFLGKKILKLEVWKDDTNMKDYTRSKGEINCGGVPYFYNEVTGSSVCGAQPCSILKEWAISKSRIKK
jgi:hypothetical protein